MKSRSTQWLETGRRQGGRYGGLQPRTDLARVLAPSRTKPSAADPIPIRQPRARSGRRSMISVCSTCRAAVCRRMRLKQAAEWFRRAADNGDLAGEVEFAILLFNGTGLAEGRSPGRALLPPRGGPRQRHCAESRAARLFVVWDAAYPEEPWSRPLPGTLRPRHRDCSDPKLARRQPCQALTPERAHPRRAPLLRSGCKRQISSAQRGQIRQSGIHGSLSAFRVNPASAMGETRRNHAMAARDRSLNRPGSQASMISFTSHGPSWSMPSARRPVASSATMARSRTFRSRARVPEISSRRLIARPRRF